MMGTFFEETGSINKDEQDELLNILYDQMFIVAYSMVRNKSDAMDIVQESWIKILEKIETLKQRDKILKWAKAIVNNTAINVLRRKSARGLLASCELAASIENNSNSEVEDIVLRKVIRESMEHLNVETREIFKFKFFYGWKDKEIAEKMDLPIGTIKARVHRGKERLRSILTGVYTPSKEIPF